MFPTRCNKTPLKMFGMVLAFISTHQTPSPIPPIREGEISAKFTVYGKIAFSVTLNRETLTAYPRYTYHDFCWVIVLKGLSGYKDPSTFYRSIVSHLKQIWHPKLKQGSYEIHKEKSRFSPIWNFFHIFHHPEKTIGPIHFKLSRDLQFRCPKLLWKFEPLTPHRTASAIFFENGRIIGRCTVG